jgi:hypothetical protein
VRPGVLGPIRPNCITRPRPALVTWPKVPVPMVSPGGWNGGVLVALYISDRNRKRWSSVTRKFLNNEKSTNGCAESSIRCWRRSTHGHPVLRPYAKNAVARMYEKFSRFLRVEICVNRMKDFGLNKGLASLKRLRQIRIEATDRFAGFEAQALNVHVDFPLFQRLALPVTVGKTNVPGIKIHDTRLLRLTEVLLHQRPANPRLAHGGDPSGGDQSLQPRAGRLM